MGESGAPVEPSRGACYRRYQAIASARCRPEPSFARLAGCADGFSRDRPSSRLRGRAARGRRQHLRSLFVPPVRYAVARAPSGAPLGARGRTPRGVRSGQPVTSAGTRRGSQPDDATPPYPRLGLRQAAGYSRLMGRRRTRDPPARPRGLRPPPRDAAVRRRVGQSARTGLPPCHGGRHCRRARSLLGVTPPLGAAAPCPSRHRRPPWGLIPESRPPQS
jgi:hypothetical protein